MLGSHNNNSSIYLQRHKKTKTNCIQIKKSMQKHACMYVHMHTCIQKKKYNKKRTTAPCIINTVVYFLFLSTFILESYILPLCFLLSRTFLTTSIHHPNTCLHTNISKQNHTKPLFSFFFSHFLSFCV